MHEPADNFFMLDDQPVWVRVARLDEIFDLRHAVIRPGLPTDTAQFDGDHEPSTVHIGAFADHRNIGCATWVLNTWAGEAAYQLRGMATDPQHVRRGVGSAVLKESHQYLRQLPGPDLLWANARLVAVPFYQRHGWAIASEEFEIAGVGPHHKMTLRLA